MCFMCCSSHLLTCERVDYCTQCILWSDVVSIGWLRLLHHCLNQCDELREDITRSICPTSDLLLTCTTLLMSSSALLYSSNIESVLLTLGLHSVDMGLDLIDHILRQTAFSSDEGLSPLDLEKCRSRIRRWNSLGNDRFFMIGITAEVVLWQPTFDLQNYVLPFIDRLFLLILLNLNSL